MSQNSQHSVVLEYIGIYYLQKQQIFICFGYIVKKIDEKIYYFILNPGMLMYQNMYNKIRHIIYKNLVKICATKHKYRSFS